MGKKNRNMNVYIGVFVTPEHRRMLEALQRARGTDNTSEVIRKAIEETAERAGVEVSAAHYSAQVIDGGKETAAA